MSIHKRRTKAGVVYDVRWRDGDRNRSTSFATADDAKEFEVAMRRRARFGAHAPAEPSEMRVEEFVGRWLRTGAVTWAPTTIRARGWMLDKWIVPYLGDTRLRDLGRAEVRDFRAQIVRDGSAPTNTNNVMRCLSAMLGVAVDEGLLPANPCHKIGTVKQMKPNRRAHDPKVTAALMKRLAPGRDQLVMGLMLYAGLRPAEVVGLTWGDIINGTIHVERSVQSRERRPVKNDSPRTFPYEPALDPLLTAAKEGRPRSGDLVVAGQRGGYLNWKMWDRNVWNKARAGAGPGDLVPYEMRHTYASTLIAQGLDLLTVAYRLGHSPRVTLDHYAHLFAQVQRPASRTSPKASAPKAPKAPKRGRSAPGPTP